MDGIRDISDTNQFHAWIISGVQVSQTVLWDDSPLKTDAFCFPQTLFEIGNTANLTAESDFPNGNQLIADRAVQQRRYHA